MSSSVTIKNIPTLTSTSSAADSVVRPKIMRRPAQFSHAEPIVIVQSPSLNTPPEKADIATSIPSKPWQDDGRFAIALVLLLVAVNLLVILWLTPAAPPPAMVHSQTPEAGIPGVTILNELNPPESNQ